MRRGYEICSCNWLFRKPETVEFSKYHIAHVGNRYYMCDCVKQIALKDKMLEMFSKKVWCTKYSRMNRHRQTRKQLYVDRYPKYKVN